MPAEAHKWLILRHSQSTAAISRNGRNTPYKHEVEGSSPSLPTIATISFRSSDRFVLYWRSALRASLVLCGHEKHG